jgi:hypothetical protein
MEGGAKSAQSDPAIQVSKLLPAEYGGFVAALVLFVSLFLPWFVNLTEQGSINGIKGVGMAFNAWQTFGLLDIVLTAACAAPFVLAWIIVRGHALSWRPGEVTMIVGLVAGTLVLLNGLILGIPGDAASGTVGITYGYWVALIGAVGIAVSGFLRQSQSIKGRRPPGSLGG